MMYSVDFPVHKATKESLVFSCLLFSDRIMNLNQKYPAVKNHPRLMMINFSLPDIPQLLWRVPKTAFSLVVRMILSIPENMWEKTEESIIFNDYGYIRPSI